MAKKKKKTTITFITNKSTFDYELLEKYRRSCPQGTEVKAMRMGKVNLKDSFCFFQNNELWVKGMHITIPRRRYRQPHPHDLENSTP